ncbi:MAG TPA: tetratricopeptide repeat protein, partial [Nitrospirales bacterium]|nr:tetratricopeptide repeat protein [Nitrospirales bacterium]
FFLDTLGWVYLKLGRGDEAVRILRQAVEKAPKQPVFNYHLGMAYFRGGEATPARLYLEKAVHAGKAFPGLEEARTVLTALNTKRIGER